MLHESYLKRMSELLKDEFQDYLNSFNTSPARALRINKKKVQDADLHLDFETSPLSFQDNGRLFENDKIGSHPYHHAGCFYVQEPSAMIPVASIDVDPSWKVLDMCACPGGKTSQVAENLKDGFIISNEIVPSRCKTLASNVERLGFENSIITNTDTDTLACLYPEYFDLVIADAPCSGEGMFRKDRRAIEEWSEANVDMCARRQKDILKNAITCTKSGGYLIYSTCTFSFEENENNVQYVLENYPELSLVMPKESVIKASSPSPIFPECRRMYPHLLQGEGQFVAVFHKEEGFCPEPKCAPLSEISKNDKETVEKFIDDFTENLSKDRLFAFKDNIVYLPHKIPVFEKITYSCGVTLGRVEKGVFRPHHQFFSSLGNHFKRKIDLSLFDTRVEKYLKGESIECDTDNGWACVRIDKFCVGGAKVVDKTAKNHYPKGLRKM